MIIIQCLKIRILLNSGFRLLNSEIGNDHDDVELLWQNMSGFRLLNSEIGNDLIISILTFLFK